MSRVVKNFRLCRPLARWKIDAPCITVLSTSKNAATAGSASTLSALSTSALAAAASPASLERRFRLTGRFFEEAITLASLELFRCGRLRRMDSNVADLLAAAAQAEPAKIALSEAATGRS